MCATLFYQIKQRYMYTTYLKIICQQGNTLELKWKKKGEKTAHRIVIHLTVQGFRNHCIYERIFANVRTIPEDIRHKQLAIKSHCLHLLVVSLLYFILICAIFKVGYLFMFSVKVVGRLGILCNTFNSDADDTCTAPWSQRFLFSSFSHAWASKWSGKPTEEVFLPSFLAMTFLLQHKEDYRKPLGLG